jgi:hypothetical protein
MSDENEVTPATVPPAAPSEITTLEIAALKGVATILTNEAGEIETLLGPVNVTVAADIENLATQAETKLGPIAGPILKTVLAQFAPQLETELASVEGQGIAALAAAANNLAAKLAA